MTVLIFQKLSETSSEVWTKSPNSEKSEQSVHYRSLEESCDVKKEDALCFHSIICAGDTEVAFGRVYDAIGLRELCRRQNLMKMRARTTIVCLRACACA